VAKTYKNLIGLLDLKISILYEISKSPELAWKPPGGTDSEGWRRQTGGIREYARKHYPSDKEEAFRKNVEMWLNGYNVHKKLGSNFPVSSISIIVKNA